MKGTRRVVNPKFINKEFQPSFQERKSYSPLMVAALNNDLEECQICVEEYKRSQSNEGQTALMLAIQSNSQNCALFLSSFEVGIQDNYDRTALIFAIKHGLYNIAQLCMSEAGQMDSTGKTALHYCFEQGFVLFEKQKHFYQYLMEVECGETYMTGKEYKGLTILGKLISRQHELPEELVKMLVKYEGMLPVTENSDEYPIHMAIKYNDYQVIKLMHEVYPDLKMEFLRRNIKSPLFTCALYNRTPMVQMFKQYQKEQDSKGRTSLMLAAAKGHLAFIKQINMDKELKMQDYNGLTALFYAIQFKQIETINYLKDFELDIRDHFGNTSLMQIIKYQLSDKLDPKLIDIMVEKLINLENNYGNYAIDYAIEYRDDLMFRKLRNEKSKTWQHLCIKYNYQIGIKLMNEQILSGINNTFLITAVESCQDILIEKYIQQLFQKNVYQQTALMLSVRNCSEFRNVPIQLLQEHGQEDIFGNLAIDYCLFNKKYSQFQQLFGLEFASCNRLGVTTANRNIPNKLFLTIKTELKTVTKQLETKDEFGRNHIFFEQFSEEPPEPKGEIIDFFGWTDADCADLMVVPDWS